jgi:hypothetical protein
LAERNHRLLNQDKSQEICHPRSKNLIESKIEKTLPKAMNTELMITGHKEECKKDNNIQFRNIKEIMSHTPRNMTIAHSSQNLSFVKVITAVNREEVIRKQKKGYLGLVHYQVKRMMIMTVKPLQVQDHSKTKLRFNIKETKEFQELVLPTSKDRDLA